jgi:hypothetical protein
MQTRDVWHITVPLHTKPGAMNENIYHLLFSFGTGDSFLVFKKEKEVRATMGICNTCQKKMTEVDTCEGNCYVEFPDGKVLPTVPYSSISIFQAANERCPDCGVASGGKHHPTCDHEICPRCKAQLITCNCFDVEAGQSNENSRLRRRAATWIPRIVRKQ